MGCYLSSLHFLDQVGLVPWAQMESLERSDTDEPHHQRHQPTAAATSVSPSSSSPFVGHTAASTTTTPTTSRRHDAAAVGGAPPTEVRQEAESANLKSSTSGSYSEVTPIMTGALAAPLLPEGPESLERMREELDRTNEELKKLRAQQTKRNEQLRKLMKELKHARSSKQSVEQHFEKLNEAVEGIHREDEQRIEWLTSENERLGAALDQERMTCRGLREQIDNVTAAARTDAASIVELRQQTSLLLASQQALTEKLRDVCAHFPPPLFFNG